MIDKIVVSIICAAYNHEKYIGKCLDGIVNQKANFKYELLINDDASTDKTAKIIREYQKKYPDIIYPVYQKENQYSKGVRITREFLYPKVRGEYVAFCEGDDYWCDEYKLQKQVDALANNITCKFCVHKVANISEDGNMLGTYKPIFLDGNKCMHDIEFLYYLIDDYPFHTSSYMMRYDDYKIYMDNLPDFTLVSDVGDVPMMLYWAQLGDIYYINDVMSCYRNMSIGGHTYNSSRLNNEKKIERYKKHIKSYELYNKFTEGKYDKFCNIQCGLLFHRICNIKKEKKLYMKLITAWKGEYYNSLSLKQKLSLLKDILIG